MTAPPNRPVKRYRAAVARSREARLRAVERRLTAHLLFLRRHDPEAHDQLVAVLRRVAARASR